MLQSTKLKGIGDLENILTSDMEMQSWSLPTVFQSCFGPVFPHYIPFPMFWKGMCGEVCDLFYDFDFTGGYS